MKISNFKFQIKRGFTLLEMLVVIGIIAILIGMGAVSYSTAQKKARDARRQSDLSAAQKMMEQCYSVNKYQYPVISGTGTISATCPAPNNSITFTVTDPLNSATYIYTYTTSTSSYTITANLETNSSPVTVTNQQ